MKSQPALHHIYSSHAFSLDMSLIDGGALIGMQVHTPQVTTDMISYTKKFLEQRCPSVLKTKCFNDLGLPFEEEVVDTELGHLFEHILIDYLCEGAIADGAKSAKFNGKTRWDWNVQPRGFFEIDVSIDNEQRGLLKIALTRAVEVVESLLNFDNSVMPIERAVLATRSNLME